MFKLNKKMFILIILLFLPMTFTDFIANNNPCCNGSNIINPANNLCIHDTNNETNIFCANSANINNTLCQINLRCGQNNTFNEEYRLFESNPLYDLRNDYDGNLVISDFHMFYYDNKMIISSDG